MKYKSIVALLIAVPLLSACWGNITLNPDGSWQGTVTLPQHLCQQAEAYGKVSVNEGEDGCVVHLNYPSGTHEIAPFVVESYQIDGGVQAVLQIGEPNVNGETRVVVFGGVDDAQVGGGGNFDLTVTAPGRVIEDNTGNATFGIGREARWEGVAPPVVLGLQALDAPVWPPKLITLLLIAVGCLTLVAGFWVGRGSGGGALT